MSLSVLINELILTDLAGLKIVLGAFFGLCLGLTGVGGGVLLIPMLQVVCDMNTVLAVGTASVISSLVKVNASVCHIRAKNVSWRSVWYLFIGAVPMTLMITQIVVYYNRHPIYQSLTNSLISTLIILVMMGSLIAVIRKYLHQMIVTEASQSVTTKHEYKCNKQAVFSGMFCGSILGSTGVGGGVLLLPILNSILKIDIKKAIGSSVVLALFLSAITALGYAKGGQIDMYTAALFTIGSFFGVPIASKLIKYLKDNTIYLLTIATIAISLILTLFA